MHDWRQIRERAGVSRDRAAVMAGVSYPTARVFEAAGPAAVKDQHKRAALIRTYSEFAPRDEGPRAA